MMKENRKKKVRIYFYICYKHKLGLVELVYNQSSLRDGGENEILKVKDAWKILPPYIHQDSLSSAQCLAINICIIFH